MTQPLPQRRNVHNVLRQVESPSSSASQTNGTSTPATSSRIVAVSTNTAGVELYDVGPYQCSPTLNLRFIASVLKGYIEETSDTLSANPLFLEVNLHAAAPYSNLNDAVSVLTAPDLPSSEELVGRVLDSSLSTYSYTWSDLRDERANLNDSWYSVRPSEQPSQGYFISESIANGQISSPDGWPNEYFVELDQYKRIFFGYGSLDDRMIQYDFSGDSHLMFPSNYLAASRNVTSDSTGQIKSGCFSESDPQTIGMKNSSWATTRIEPASQMSDTDGRLWSLSRNSTSCGISPILHSTLNNQTAGEDSAEYVEFVQSTIWNWAPDEPRSIPSSNDTQADGDTEARFRCALMMTDSSTYPSRWRVEDCRRKHRVACRVEGQPYRWRLSAGAVAFAGSETACDADSDFSAPRTGLENQYLYQHVLSLPDQSRSEFSGNNSGLWVNLNSLDVEFCWVTTGPEGACPYLVDEEEWTTRAILVPVIAALVILALTALTLFVKCNKNRRNSRKRVRGEGGWLYEGVPG